MDSIIFDLDGTLWNSVTAVCDSWNSVITRHFPELAPLTPERLSVQMGKLLDDIVMDLYPQLDAKRRGLFLTECGKNEMSHLSRHGGILFDGVEETLQRLSKDYRLYIVSNCQSGYIEAFFKAHGLQKYFSDFECGGNTGKPKGENIKLVIKRNNLRSAVYVGDTELDGQSAAYAGIPFIWAAYGFGTALEYDGRLDSFTDLPALVGGMKANGQQ